MAPCPRIWNKAKTSALLSHYSSESQAQLAARCGVTITQVQNKLSSLRKRRLIPAAGRRWDDSALAKCASLVGNLRPGYIEEEFGRTSYGCLIALRRRRIRQLENGVFKNTYRLPAVARFFGVSHGLVARWVREKKLYAVKRPTLRGHEYWVIYPGDLIDFCRDHPEEYDHALVPREVGGRPNPVAGHLPPRLPDPTLSPKEVAKELDISVGTVWRYIHEGLLPQVKIGRRYNTQARQMFVASAFVARVKRTRRSGEPVRATLLRLKDE